MLVRDGYMAEEQIVIDSSVVYEFEQRADELILSDNQDELSEFASAIDNPCFVFDTRLTEARYFYTLANCYSLMYKYHETAWYSEDLSKAVINYRKALYAIKNEKECDQNHINLRSCIETNLANWLSSQGRSFCCIPHWDSAIQLDKNPVAITAKAENELFVARSIYDETHRPYHYYHAYKLTCDGFKSIDALIDEQKIPYQKDGNLFNFKAWFEANFELSDFSDYKDFKNGAETRKHHDYLKWCGDNHLFLNDLNDVDTNKIVYQDIITLPSIWQDLNPLLALHEELVYHGGFDEIKNDYCYARYLLFVAQSIPTDQLHFFNSTYPHVDDATYSVTNLKASHYKSVFRTLYSIFDKIAYFLSSFYELKDLDSKIYFYNIFGDLKNDKLKPHPKLIDNQNCFLHALFYILKDFRDSNQKDSNVDVASRWLDPEAKAFSEIRNAMEHRSLKIVDDLAHFLTKSDIDYRQLRIKQTEKEIENLKSRIADIGSEIGNDRELKSKLEQEQLQVETELKNKTSMLSEQQKRAKHSLLITDVEFESRLFTLIKLVRNSIMYLSLAIHRDQEGKTNDSDLIIQRDVPLKGN